MRIREPLPALHALKQDVAREVVALLDGWSQWNAAVILGVHQSTISKLRAGKLHAFTLDRLIGFLLVLDRDVAIITRRRAGNDVCVRHERVDRLAPRPRNPRA